MSIFNDYMKSGENLVFSTMKDILEQDYSNDVIKENTKYFCRKIAEIYEDDLDEDIKEYFLNN